MRKLAPLSGPVRPRRSRNRWGWWVAGFCVVMAWTQLLNAEARAELEPVPERRAVAGTTLGPVASKRASAGESATKLPLRAQPRGTRSAPKASHTPPVGLGALTVPEALLRAGRDAVARRVVAAWGSVMDVEALRAADVDLVERGLALCDFSLREAIVRHRTMQPSLYGKDGVPRTSGALRKALDYRSLRVFLEAFAAQQPTAPHGAAGDVWAPGDLVYVKPSPRRARLLVAVVSDRTDGAGGSLMYTLNPLEGAAREDHSVAAYPVRGHFRLDGAALDRARDVLGMGPAHKQRSTAISR